MTADAALVELSKGPALQNGDFARAAQAVTETAARTLQVDRVSVWLFTSDRSAIRMVDLFERGTGRHSEGTRLAASDYPSYFQALESERNIAAHDAVTDARTREFAESYLRPLGIGSLLDAPIRLGGRVAGVVCHERVGTPREWSREEQNFAGAVADLLSLALEAGDRRRAEQALKETEEHLRHAQKMEAIGRLAGGVAHDFNNLLTVINGYTEILMQTELDSARRRDLDEVRKAGLRAVALTRQLLTFSRRQEVRPQIVDLNAVVVDMEKMLRRLLGEDVRLETRLDEALGLVKADSGQLEQVIMNLAVNARDAMPQGGTLTIETVNVGATELALRVTDTGCGMEPEVVARIFEPFFTTKEVGKGTGLGLSVVYGVVEQAGGRIDVTSEPGKGTAFTITLPRAQEAARRDEGGTPQRDQGGSETVLLVEDEPSVRALARAVLQARGYTVLEATNGAEAYRSGTVAGVDLVLTDVVMPEMGGPELVRQLRAERPALKVLYMSGHSGKQGALGAEAVLEKPFTLDSLSKKVRDVLDRAS